MDPWPRLRWCMLLSARAGAVAVTPFVSPRAEEEHLERALKASIGEMAALADPVQALVVDFCVISRFSSSPPRQSHQRCCLS